ncbi:MAG TPA: succinate dehydrogenase/fumarate reductase iron-sulfur subunit [Azospirillaceae bacterium]|nr:succinate dehydrogenase/fumarate reductase iron-sulfur subunit [Azospirillaceae bacterium]
MSQTLEVQVWRGREDGGYQTFEVPARDNQTILDVVTHIQRELDPTLSYRFACRVGMCGSCAMTVNGKARWTCRTHVKKVAPDGKLQLQPLSNMPVIKDLVADMAEFFNKWTRAKGYFVPAEKPSTDFAMIAPDSPKRQEAEVGIECINCGICYASCDVVAWKPAYLGPAQLNRAWTLVNDERDHGQRDRARAVSGDAGCHSCHSLQACTERCPKHLDPAYSIAGLKRLTMKAALRGEL